MNQERQKDPNFRKDIFEKKVQEHVRCGYSRELAEDKVISDYNGLFLKSLGINPNRKMTDSEGYYIK